MLHKDTKKRKKSMPIDLSQVGHFDVRTEEGLTAAQVADRTENGLNNIDTSKKSKTIPHYAIKKIYKNALTFSGATRIHHGIRDSFYKKSSCSEIGTR